MASAPAALRSGMTAGNWLLSQHLATGGYGEVWIAHHVSSSRRAAVKILHAELVSSEESVGRFLREAEVIGAIEHPNVVGLYEGGRLTDGRPYIAMELIEGETLAERIKRRKRLPLAEVAPLIAQLADGLEVAHAVGVIHRDIKASNVMIRPVHGGERVVLLDFGIAKLTAADAPSLTASQFTVGTPVCMAPEQLLGKPVEPRTDVYALGVLAHFCLTGEQPFADSPAMLLPYLHQHGERPRPSKVADVPPALDAAIAKAMAPDPTDRHDSAIAFARELAAALTSALAPPIQKPCAREPQVGIHLVASLAPNASGDPQALAEFERALEQGEDELEALGARLIAETDNSLTFVMPSGQSTALARLAAKLCNTTAALEVALLVDAGDEDALGEPSRWSRQPGAIGLVVSESARELLSRD